MGYAMAHSRCYGCGQMMSYNPMRVPSVRIKDGRPDPEGKREPICRSCIERVNPRRIANGLEPIVPFADAYEPCDESDLDWG